MGEFAFGLPVAVCNPPHQCFVTAPIGVRDHACGMKCGNAVARQIERHDMRAGFVTERPAPGKIGHRSDPQFSSRIEQRCLGQVEMDMDLRASARRCSTGMRTDICCPPACSQTKLSAPIGSSSSTTAGSETPGRSSSPMVDMLGAQPEDRLGPFQHRAAVIARKVDPMLAELEGAAIFHGGSRAGNSSTGEPMKPATNRFAGRL